MNFLACHAPNSLQKSTPDNLPNYRQGYGDDQRSGSALPDLRSQLQLWRQQEQFAHAEVAELVFLFFG